MPRASIALASLSLVSLLGALALAACGLGSPPEPSTSCATEAPPSGDEPALFFSHPAGGPEPIPTGSVFHLQHSAQAGPHVTVGIRHYTEAGGAWVYEVAFEPELDESDSTAGSTIVRGSNTVSVEACDSGWTETITPVFITVEESGEPGAARGSQQHWGVLRVDATSKASGERLSAELRARIQM